MKPEAGLHSVTDTQALSLSQGPSTAEKNDKGGQEGPEPESVGVETAQFLAVQPVDATPQSETATATTQAIGTVLDSYCEEQAVVEVEEKKQLTVSDTSMSRSGTVATAPESSGAVAKASGDDKHMKGTQEKSKSAHKTLLKQGPRGQDGSVHTSSKKPVQRKRHKRTGPWLW